MLLTFLWIAHNLCIGARKSLVWILRLGVQDGQLQNLGHFIFEGRNFVQITIINMYLLI